MLRAISTGLRSAVIAAAGTATIGGRVYLALAPQDAALPYAVLTPVAGGSENRTPRDAFEMLWQVDVVATDGAAALAIAEDVRDALQMLAGGAAEPITLADGWKLQTVLHEAPVYWVEQVDKRQYCHAVDSYRIVGTK